ncbi:MAG: GNAT family N-acetyltransferase [Anaerolineae bacterium]|nr:GNAT family N-acetyltransferase [Anaerolineae bacterium]
MDLPLDGEFTFRPATLDDVEGAVALVNACSFELIGRPEYNPEQFRNDWQSPSMHLETDLRVFLNRDGEMVGYAGVWDMEPHVQIFGWANVHPQWLGRGIGAYLERWLENRARQAVPKAPAGARVILEQRRLTVDAPALRFLDAHGYRVTRYFSRMRIDMCEPPPAARFPRGIVATTCADLGPSPDGWLRDLVLADQDIFRDHWGYVEHSVEDEIADWRHWIEHAEAYDPSLWFLAVEDGTGGNAGEIAGLAVCDPKTAEDPDMAYVASFGVRRRWRRQGVGLALLHHAFGVLWARGTRKVALDVDADSLTGATRLYERAGMRVERQSVSYEKELRPGDDLTTQRLD